MLLSRISSPSFMGILSVLTLLALAWGLVLTIFTLANIYKKLELALNPYAKARWLRFLSKLGRANTRRNSQEVIEQQNMNTNEL